MGSQESKIAEQVPEKNEETKETELNDSSPSTPILTPVDPRSPSTNIARTPLDLILGKTKIENATEITETEDDQIVTKTMILHLDPRSPTVEFDRTPIIISTQIKEKSLKLNNKNFDNVRKSTFQTTPTNSSRKSNIIPPKLLGSSPISVNPNAHKRRSLVGLLETNIDFTETDLDSVHTRNENLNSEDLKYSNIIKEEFESEAVSPHLEPNNEILDETPKEEEIENQIESLDIQPQDEIAQDTSNEGEEDNDLQHEVKVEANKNIEVTDCGDENDKILQEKSINLTAHVKDFDKKLTNLIYQDESEDDENKLGLRLTKLKENNRTPLGERNSNETKKTTTRLRVSDKPRKMEISKIPVFKDMHGKKIGVQCENTPPKNMEEKRIKTRISQWDADKTLII